MMRDSLYILRIAAWAPGVETRDKWAEWALGKREIRASRESPDLEFTDPLFKRRLSQISKMTIQVIHDLLPLEEDTKIVFLSFRGELAQQYKINKMLIEEKSLMPAAFSLSVFNTPAALAAIALKLEAGYSAVYPGQNSFAAGLAVAAAPVLCGRAENSLVVYADEMPPPEYSGVPASSGLCPEACEPLAFGVLLSREPGQNSVRSLQWSSLMEAIPMVNSPQAFLKKMLLTGQGFPK
jgi:hypothetical protein